MTGSISSNPRQQASLFQPYISEKLYPHLRIISTADNGANPDVWTVIVIEGIRQAIVADWPALLSVFFVNSYLTSEVVGVSATKIIRYSWNAAVRASAKGTSRLCPGVGGLASAKTFRASNCPRWSFTKMPTGRPSRQQESASTKPSREPGWLW